MHERRPPGGVGTGALMVRGRVLSETGVCEERQPGVRAAGSFLRPLG